MGNARSPASLVLHRLRIFNKGRAAFSPPSPVPNHRDHRSMSHFSKCSRPPKTEKVRLTYGLVSVTRVYQ